MAGICFISDVQYEWNACIDSASVYGCSFYNRNPKLRGVDYYKYWFKYLNGLITKMNERCDVLFHIGDLTSFGYQNGHMEIILELIDDQFGSPVVLETLGNHDIINPNDKCWLNWCSYYAMFYYNNRVLQLVDKFKNMTRLSPHLNITMIDYNNIKGDDNRQHISVYTGSFAYNIKINDVYYININYGPNTNINIDSVFGTPFYIRPQYDWIKKQLQNAEFPFNIEFNIHNIFTLLDDVEFNNLLSNYNHYNFKFNTGHYHTTHGYSTIWLGLDLIPIFFHGTPYHGNIYYKANDGSIHYSINGVLQQENENILNIPLI